MACSAERGGDFLPLLNVLPPASSFPESLALIDLLWVVDEAWRAGVTGMDQTGSGMVMPEQQR